MLTLPMIQIIDKKIGLNNFKLKNYKKDEYSKKQKKISYMHSGYGIAFDKACSWSFG